ncbi:unnamed protein product, partial [Aphanomyces euteiches]
RGCSGGAEMLRQICPRSGISIQKTSKSTRNVAQLVEWKLVMKHFEDVCAESGLNLSRNLSDDELIISSRMISGYLQTICTAKSDKRRRRVPQLKLMSIVRDVRAAIKKRKVDE